MGSLGIALFAPYLPVPAVSGGRIRIHRVMKRLLELGQVQLFAAAHPWFRGMPGLTLAHDWNEIAKRFAAVVERAVRQPRSLHARVGT